MTRQKRMKHYLRRKLKYLVPLSFLSLSLSLSLPLSLSLSFSLPPSLSLPLSLSPSLSLSLSLSFTNYPFFLVGAAGEGTRDAVGENANVEEERVPAVATAPSFAPSAEGAKQAAAAAAAAEAPVS